MKRVLGLIGGLMICAAPIFGCDSVGDPTDLDLNTFRVRAEGKHFLGPARFERKPDSHLTLYLDTRSTDTNGDNLFGVRLRDDRLATAVAGDRFSPHEAYYSTTKGVFRLGRGEVRIVQSEPIIRGTFSLDLQREVGVFFPFTEKAQVDGSFAISR